MAKEELLDKVQAFQDMLISYATGGPATEEEFKAVRTELLDEPYLKDHLPRLVRSCRNLAMFWALMKKQSGTYKGRREYLWGEFGPLIEELEGKSGSPADSHVTETLTDFQADDLHQAWRDALERRIDDPDGAITSARTLIESVCKHILEEANVAYEDKYELPKLYSLTAQRLNLAPSQQTESILKQVTGGCSAVVEGIGAMRNKLGDAHGRGSSSAKPALSHAELAVNLAGALAVFLIATWEKENVK